MPRYLLSIYQPDGEPPPPEFLEPIMADLAVLNAEMKAKGAWVFAGGLFSPDTATVLQCPDRGDQLLTTDGPFVDLSEAASA